MAKNSHTVWRLRKGLERRFKSGHPWVYSNELQESPKGILPGDSIELQDAGGKFLARGYGNPKSLIAFRSVSRMVEDQDPMSNSSILKALKKSGELRLTLGLGDFSHRLCFGESDGISGLIIDRYLTENGQVFVVQAHTAGADRLLIGISEVLKSYVEFLRERLPTAPTWDLTSVVLRNDLGVRKLEGIEEQEPQILKQVPSHDLKNAKIFIQAALGGKPLVFRVDLVAGQKTGFFMDQAANIHLAALRFKSWAKGRALSTTAPVRILDLCSYVGQWGAQIARVAEELGIAVEVVALDASAPALELAQKNIEAQGAKCETLRGDIFNSLEQLKDRSFDWVICDPPALIKSRKDISVGTHAYLQLATQVFRIAKAGGGVVCCSCSALLEEEVFLEKLARAAQRNGRKVQWIGRGSPAPDHPLLAEFPEGRYLKGWVGIVDSGVSDGL